MYYAYLLEALLTYGVSGDTDGELKGMFKSMT